jgi:hypothetical protein
LATAGCGLTEIIGPLRQHSLKLGQWRRLNGTNQLPKVIGGVRFQDGIEVIEVPANRAA